MAITASYSVNNPAGVAQSEVDLLIGLTNEALRLWGGVLAGSASFNIKLDFIDTTENRATGGWTSGVPTGTLGGFALYLGNPAAELMAGLNAGTQTDLTITVDPDYLRGELFLDPTPATRTDIPASRTDGLSVLLHEIGHAIGFIGYYRESTDTFDFATKTTYDYRLLIQAGEVFFDGPNVRALLGAPIPLTDNNYAHYGNTNAFPGTSTDPLTGLMNGVVFYRGYAYTIGDLDLAVLADTGLGTIRDDILDLPFLASMRGGAGNDTITGGAGANQLFGDEGNDTLRGNAGDDTIDGGPGNDTAMFAGSRGAYTIQIRAGGEVTVTGTDGTDTVRNVETLRFDDQVFLINTTGGGGTPVPSGGFRLFTSAGWSGAVGGNVTLTGTNGHERIAIVDQPGTITLDGSFSRGNDVIVLDGAASAWSAVRVSASVARLSDGDTFVDVPVGGTGLAVSFDDGARMLRFDGTGTMVIGTQAIGNAAGTIVAPASASALPGGVDPGATARMFVTNGNGPIAVSGRAQVIGTNDAERLHLLSGTITLDGSFTRDNDTLVLDYPANTYQAERIAGQLHLFGNGLDLVTPAGAGLLIDFPDSDRSLAISGQSMILGAQVIGTSAQFLFA